MHFNLRISKWIFPWAALGAAISISSATPCWADEEPVVSLQWIRGSGAAECPDQAKLAREVAARLGRDPFVDHGPRQIVGWIERHNGVFSLQLDEQGPDNHTVPITQTSSSPNCDAIFAYTVVAVSMIIAPKALDAAPSSSIPPIKQEPCAPPEPTIPVPPPVIQVISPPPPVRLSLFVQGGILQGFLPSLAPQWGIETRAGGHRFEASLGLFQTGERPSADGGFTFQNYAGSLGLCVRAIDLALVSLWGCGHAWFGAITLDAVDPSNYLLTKDGPFPWFGASLAPRLRVALPLSLRIEGGAHVLFNMPPQGFNGRYTSNTSDNTSDNTFNIYTQDWINIAPFISLGISIL